MTGCDLSDPVPQSYSWDERILWFGTAAGKAGGQLCRGLPIAGSKSQGVVNDISIQGAGVRHPEDRVHTVHMELQSVCVRM